MVEMGTSWESGEEINKESKFKKKTKLPKKKTYLGPKQHTLGREMVGVDVL